MIDPTIMQPISQIVHPQYSDSFLDFYLWRLSYFAGRRFITEYTQKLSERESDKDFLTRLLITYAPSFAKTAINEVKNKLFQRFIDISREGGTTTYQEGVRGGKYGVDLVGSTMDAFLGRKILPELLIMKKVGIIFRPRKASIVDPTRTTPYLPPL